MKMQDRPKLFGHKMRLTWFEIAMSLVCLGLGLSLSIWPQKAHEGFLTVLGAIAIVIGLASLVHYAMLDLAKALTSNEMVNGLIWVTVGIVTIVFRKVLLALLPIFLGLYILYCGLNELQMTLNLKRLEAKKWLSFLVISLISVALGTITLCSPFAVADDLMRFVGISLIFEGLFSFACRFIYVGFYEKHPINNFRPTPSVAVTNAAAPKPVAPAEPEPEEKSAE